MALLCPCFSPFPFLPFRSASEISSSLSPEVVKGAQPVELSVQQVLHVQAPPGPRHPPEHQQLPHPARLQTPPVCSNIGQTRINVNAELLWTVSAHATYNLSVEFESFHHCLTREVIEEATILALGKLSPELQSTGNQILT